MRGRRIIWMSVLPFLVAGCAPVPEPVPPMRTAGPGLATGVSVAEAVEANPPIPEVTKAPVPNPVHYRSCKAVRAAGAAPLRKGDPGYSRKLDRDGDGTACES